MFGRHTSAFDSAEAERPRTVETRVSNMEGQLDYIENQRKQNNIRIERIPEVCGETREGTEQIRHEIFHNSLGFYDNQGEHAHHVNKKVPGKSHTVIMNLTSIKESWS